MKLVKREKSPRLQLVGGHEEITAEDERRFWAIATTELTTAQQQLVSQPTQVFPHQESVLAVHWHPEFVPMELIRARITALYPKSHEELIIPTQHNRINAYDDYCGVEVDCYSRGFQRKVQLLLHFHHDRLSRTRVLQGALEHTFQYRTSQFFDLVRTFTKPNTERLDQAARATGVDHDVISLVREQAAKLEILVERHYDNMHPDIIKNRLLRNFLGTLNGVYDRKTINRAHIFLSQVKNIVKAEFSPDYFYRTSEIIEEARGIGAGVVVPHPEEFWPILLAEYDVDGYEVWNPQSREYTDFLISVLVNKNRRRDRQQRPLLLFMGDDTHMSAKIRPPEEQKVSKGLREIGYQPPWDDLNLRKKLIMTQMDRLTLIQEYKARLAS
ncbi:MAG: hypothetical protein EYX74_07330 [Desulfobulbaceae bacterium]|nr:MAG: hypothetical protein EYX74_07330 [Desulfobulbaceae bacterium]